MSKTTHGLQGSLTVTVHRCKDLKDVQIVGKQDPYCKVKIGSEKFKTKVAEDGGRAPVWNQMFLFNLDAKSNAQDMIHFEVLNSNLTTDDLIGRADIKITELVKQLNSKKWIQIVDKDNFTKMCGQLEVTVEFKGTGLPETAAPQPTATATPTPTPAPVQPVSPPVAQPVVQQVQQPPVQQYHQPPVMNQPPQPIYASASPPVYQQQQPVIQPVMQSIPPVVQQPMMYSSGGYVQQQQPMMYASAQPQVVMQQPMMMQPGMVVMQPQPMMVQQPMMYGSAQPMMMQQQQQPQYGYPGQQPMYR